MLPALIQRLHHRRVADRKMLGGYVPRHQRPCCHYCAVAESHAFQNDRPSPDKAAFTNRHRSRGARGVIRPFSVGKRRMEICVGDQDVRR